MEFDLIGQNILGAISKRAFRQQNTAKSYVSLTKDETRDDCDLTLSLSYQTDFISFIIGDSKDFCIPYVIDGEIDIVMTEEEEFEEMVSEEILDPLTGDSSSKSFSQQ